MPGAGLGLGALLSPVSKCRAVRARALRQLLLERGIRADTTVVLHGRNNLTAARAAHLRLYAGVSEVRLLDGGLANWTGAGLALERRPPFHYPAASEFGASFPLHPEYLIDMRQAKALLRQPDGVLAGILTWNEFTGKTSGYPYIPARGDIRGARWGQAGDDDNVNSMSAFHKPDGTIKAASEFCRLWRLAGIHPGRKTAFYCGTGWRASLAFFDAWLMNWKRISVYHGGWHEWSRHPGNPVVCRAGLF